MAGDKGSQANPMVAFRDLVRGEASKVSKANDQVILGVLCAVKDGIDVEVQIDGFGSGPIDALWCLPGVQPTLGMRVVMNALTGGDKWFIVAVASAGTGYAGFKIFYNNPGTSAFLKTEFPGLRAIRIELVGGGGGGGGCSTTNSTQASGGGAGGGAGYAETWVRASDLFDSEVVIVGAGGAGGAPGDGVGGGVSVFEAGNGVGLTGGGMWCRANGGNPGFAGVASSNLPKYGGSAGSGGQGTIGNIRIDGTTGEMAVLFETQVAGGSLGGASHIGPTTGRHFFTFSGSDGADGRRYGSGGGGGQNADDQGEARSGGDGADGLVIVELIF